MVPGMVSGWVGGYFRDHTGMYVEASTSHFWVPFDSEGAESSAPMGASHTVVIPILPLFVITPPVIMPACAYRYSNTVPAPLDSTGSLFHPSTRTETRGGPETPCLCATMNRPDTACRMAVSDDSTLWPPSAYSK